MVRPNNQTTPFGCVPSGGGGDKAVVCGDVGDNRDGICGGVV